MADSFSELELKIAAACNARSSHLLLAIDEAGLPLTRFFSMETPELAATLQINPRIIGRRAARMEALEKARKEADFIKRNNIRALYITDPDYPSRLKECPDAPGMIFVLGNCDLDSPNFLSIVGTRRATEYGIDFCNSFIDSLCDITNSLTIVSGLAYGIDVTAHSRCLDKSIPTVAVVAHGLDSIYPASHRSIARKIISDGGAIITEYLSGTPARRGNFLERNRIIAGLSDATLIVESELKGGAMSTARFAVEYNRDLFALPGRISDQMSRGCNALIRRDQAHLADSASEFAKTMQWAVKVSVEPVQHSLFDGELSATELAITEAIREASRNLSADELQDTTGLSITEILTTLSEMEFDGKIRRHPGNTFSVII